MPFHCNNSLFQILFWQNRALSIQITIVYTQTMLDCIKPVLENHIATFQTSIHLILKIAFC